MKNQEKIKESRKENIGITLFLGFLFIGLIISFFASERVIKEWEIPEAKRLEIHNNLIGYWEEIEFHKYDKETITFLNKGVKVNGKLVSTDYKLNFMGDEIEFNFGLKKYYCEILEKKLKCKVPYQKYESQFQKISSN